MKIPYKIRVGTRYYSVLEPEKSATKGKIGSTFYAERVIEVAKRSNRTGRLIAPAVRRTVFWHETTHAILHDMAHPLHTDEKFVTAFANRLSAAIDSARFL